MTNINNIEQKIEAALNSVEGVQRAQPAPYLLTRINAALANKGADTVWEKMAAFISRPAVAFALIAAFAVFNFWIIFSNNSDVNYDNAIAAGTTITEEYAANIDGSFLYENEQP